MAEASEAEKSRCRYARLPALVAQFLLTDSSVTQSCSDENDCSGQRQQDSQHRASCEENVVDDTLNVALNPET